MSDSISRGELEDIIGDRATDELLRAWGGAFYYIPKTLPDFHPLVSIVGRYNAGLLCQCLGGIALDLPTLDDREIDKRNEVIGQRLSEGHTQAQVAAEFGLSVRQVRAIYHSHKQQRVKP